MAVLEHPHQLPANELKVRSTGWRCRENPGSQGHNSRQFAKIQHKGGYLGGDNPTAPPGSDAGQSMCVTSWSDNE